MNCSQPFRSTNSANTLDSQSKIQIIYDSIPEFFTTPDVSISFNVLLREGVLVKDISCQLNMDSPFNCPQKSVTLPGLADGSHTLKVTVIESDNLEMESTLTFKKDSTAPVIRFVSIPPSVDQSTSPTIIFDVADNLSGLNSIDCSHNGQSFVVGCKSPFALSKISLGPHTFTIRVTDMAGNTSTLDHSWTVKDTPALTPPQIASSVLSTTQSTESIFTFSSTDSESKITGYQCAIDLAAPISCSSPQEYFDLSIGDHSFTVRSLDGEGNISSPAIFNWTITASSPPQNSRDVLKQPFSSTSIWNMPIGTGAHYVAANISVKSGFKISKADEENIILTPTSPKVKVYYNGVGWNGGDRCEKQGGLLTQIPIPSNYVVPSNGENESTAALLSDGRTIVQLQPLTRCSASEDATALVVWSSVDIYGDGITGAHGGSSLSAIGGSLRVGELRPGQPAPRHALKVIVDTYSTLYKCTQKSDCYRWPASTADNYAVGHYGTKNPNAPFAMRMGALLAIPTSTTISSLGLETEPAIKLAFTLQNYGAYIVDDTWQDGFGFAMEKGPGGSFRQQFKSDYGFDFVANVGSNSPWTRDMEKLVKALAVIDNNSSNTIGGGGTPLQDLAPPVSP